MGISVSLAIRLNVFVLSLTLIDFSFSLLGRVSKLSKLREPSIPENLSSSSRARFPNDLDKEMFLGGRESENLDESSVNPESVGDGCWESEILGGIVVAWERDLLCWACPVSMGCKEVWEGGGLLGRGGGGWGPSEGTVRLGGGGGESAWVFSGVGGRTESAGRVGRLSSTGRVL